MTSCTKFIFSNNVLSKNYYLHLIYNNPCVIYVSITQNRKDTIQSELFSKIIFFSMITFSNQLSKFNYCLISPTESNFST